MAKMIRIIIVEDNKTIREGLAVLLNATDGLKCVGRYKSCELMLESLEETRPDLVLMDIGLPGMSGIEGIAEVHRILPQTLILMLSVYDDNDNIFRALCAGACGYLVKKTPPARLIEAIQEAHAGGSPMSAHIARKVVTYFQQRGRASDQAETTLSERETEILTRLSEGNSYKLIADAACISID